MELQPVFTFMLLWRVQGSYLLYFWCVFPIYFLRAVCPTYVILHDLMTLIIFGAPYNGDGNSSFVRHLFSLLPDILPCT